MQLARQTHAKVRWFRLHSIGGLILSEYRPRLLLSRRQSMRLLQYETQLIGRTVCEGGLA